ncbi:MAG: 3-phosphoshikimate 1-carboxyvinyltransferase, partial [Candidatus Sericytochromatia bacterium]
METRDVSPAIRLEGRLEIPPDKSLSHRAILFAALAEGESRLTNVLRSEDC